jgi:hypothetical protein
MAALLGSLGPDGMPDFDKIAAASGMDPKEMKGHAARLWKHMDNLSADPAEYAKFMDKQAQNAGVDPSVIKGGAAGAGGGGGGGGGGIPGMPGFGGVGGRGAGVGGSAG